MCIYLVVVVIYIYPYVYVCVMYLLCINTYYVRAIMRKENKEWSNI